MAARLQDIVRPSDRLSVGLSGGVDSVVLLDCLRRAARSLRFRLSAVHVNHRLSPNAGRWAAFCRQLCRAQRVPFRTVSVTVPRAGGPEAAARSARYGVFAKEDCDYIALAHHCDDQVETFLIQLFRGSGLKGLAAMPFLRAEGGRRKAEGKSRKSSGTGSSSLVPHPSSPRIIRPLLDVTRQEIVEYAKRRKLRWVEDESNADPYYPRNCLRREVLPAVARRFPAYRTAVARSARHIAEAAAVLDEVAASDGQRFLQDGTLAVAGLRGLSTARARNLLRYFIAGHGMAMPATGRIEEALRQALAAKEDARVAIELDGAVLRRFDGRLYLVKHMTRRAMAPRPWRGEKSIALPELDGTVSMAPVTGSGISLARLKGKPVTIRSRRGGERIQPDCGRPRRSLKKLLQEMRMPPWQRERLPLIFHGETLVWAPGIGIDCAFQAGSGDAALMPAWTPAR